MYFRGGVYPSIGSDRKGQAQQNYMNNVVKQVQMSDVPSNASETWQILEFNHHQTAECLCLGFSVKKKVQ